MAKFLKKKSIITSLFILGFFLPLSSYAFKISDPLNAQGPFEIAARIIQAILGVVGAVALLNFIIAGIGIIISRGDAQKLKAHRDNLLWTSIGIALIFASYALLSFFLENITKGT